MKLRYLLLASVVTSSAVMATDDVPVDPVTEDGMVKVQWQEPSKYRDIKSSGELQSRFENRMFETLTENLNKEAQKVLKPEQKLELVVTDVDLAGDMRPTFGVTANDLRVVKDMYPPRMTFSYQVLEGSQVVMAGDEKLTDMNFMSQVGKFNDKPFMYETQLLTDWLKKTVVPKL